MSNFLLLSERVWLTQSCRIEGPGCICCNQGNNAHLSGFQSHSSINGRTSKLNRVVMCRVCLPQAGSNINMNIMWTAASLVLTRCFTVYTTAQTQRTLLQQQMTSTLYDKMQDSQEGVVSVIMEVRVRSTKRQSTPGGVSTAQHCLPAGGWGNSWCSSPTRSPVCKRAMLE